MWDEVFQQEKTQIERNSHEVMVRNKKMKKN